MTSISVGDGEIPDFESDSSGFICLTEEIPRGTIPACLALGGGDYRVPVTVQLKCFDRDDSSKWILLPAGSILDVGERVGRVLGVHVKGMCPGGGLGSEDLAHLEVGRPGGECKTFFDKVGFEPIESSWFLRKT